MKIRRIVSVFLLAVLMSILCLPPLAYADEPLDIVGGYAFYSSSDRI